MSDSAAAPNPRRRGPKPRAERTREMKLILGEASLSALRQLGATPGVNVSKTVERALLETASTKSSREATAAALRRGASRMMVEARIWDLVDHALTVALGQRQWASWILGHVVVGFDGAKLNGDGLIEVSIPDLDHPSIPLLELFLLVSGRIVAPLLCVLGDGADFSATFVPGSAVFRLPSLGLVVGF